MLIEVRDKQQLFGIAIVHDVLQAAINSLRHRELFLQVRDATTELHSRIKQLVKKDRRLFVAVRSLTSSSTRSEIETYAPMQRQDIRFVQGADLSATTEWQE